MIAIIDYGMGNLRSVQKGFERAGHEAVVSSDAKTILSASKVVLPGVGAFPDCMRNLEQYGLIDAVRDSIKAGKPLNEGRQVAESTLSAIMGRISAYTGQVVQWDWAMNKSRLDLWPKEELKLGPYPVPPVAVPGETKLL